MKKFFYISGFLAAVVLIVTSSLSLLRISYTIHFFSLSYLWLSFVFIPYYAFGRLKKIAKTEMKEKYKYTALIVSSYLVALSGFFKLMHFSGSDQLLVTGVGVFCIGFLPLFFMKLYASGN
jgi:uncharacterized membrane protein